MKVFVVSICLVASAGSCLGNAFGARSSISPAAQLAEEAHNRDESVFAVLSSWRMIRLAQKIVCPSPLLASELIRVTQTLELPARPGRSLEEVSHAEVGFASPSLASALILDELKPSSVRCFLSAAERSLRVANPGRRVQGSTLELPRDLGALGVRGYALLVRVNGYRSLDYQHLLVRDSKDGRLVCNLVTLSVGPASFPVKLAAWLSESCTARKRTA